MLKKLSDILKLFLFFLITLSIYPTLLYINNKVIYAKTADYLFNPENSRTYQGYGHLEINISYPDPLEPSPIVKYSVTEEQYPLENIAKEESTKCVSQIYKYNIDVVWNFGKENSSLFSFLRPDSYDSINKMNKWCPPEPFSEETQLIVDKQSLYTVTQGLSYPTIFYPFDTYKMLISTNMKTKIVSMSPEGNDTETIDNGNLMTMLRVIAPGWEVNKKVGDYYDENQVLITEVILRRPSSIVFYCWFIIISITIINILLVTEILKSKWEVAFTIMFSIWTIRQQVIPDSIKTITLFDVFIFSEILFLIYTLHLSSKKVSQDLQQEVALPLSQNKKPHKQDKIKRRSNKKQSNFKNKNA